MGENGIAELDLDIPGLKISLRKNSRPEHHSVAINQGSVCSTPSEAHQSAPLAVVEKKGTLKTHKETETPKPADNPQWHKVLSPMAGTFYRSPSPNSPVYVNEGDLVNLGQAICIVEAMKLMNEIKADRTGKIVKILVENSKPVEKGTELFIIETAG
ncbi:MAG: acetyl-CoA carboxylase, biotin carboxyl carrier protein [uncultured bacterium]|nr:MAG: acetyl-CoA carboxylase, biotin carboxyl carrier protein [uncultured bacterium]